VQVLADGFPADDPRREVTTQILRQSERMDKTIRDLLNYAQRCRGALPDGRQRDLERACFIALPNPAHDQVRRSNAFGCRGRWPTASTSSRPS
jgi:signal transduction histidine kinase